MIEANPWSRLTLSEHCGLHGVRDWLRRYVRGLRGLPKGMPNKPQRAAQKASRWAQHLSVYLKVGFVEVFGVNGTKSIFNNICFSALNTSSGSGQPGGSTSTSSSSTGSNLIPRVAFLSSRHNSNNSNQNEAAGGRNVVRRQSQPMASRKDLAPVRERKCS